MALNELFRPDVVEDLIDDLNKLLDEPMPRPHPQPAHAITQLVVTVDEESGGLAVVLLCDTARDVTLILDTKERCQMLVKALNDGARYIGWLDEEATDDE